MSSYVELKKQAESLLAQAEQARKEEVANVLSKIKSTMETYNIDVADVVKMFDAKQARQKAGLKYPPKYRDPNSNKTWTGMGRAPLWMPADKNDWQKFAI